MKCDITLRFLSQHPPAHSGLVYMMVCVFKSKSRVLLFYHQKTTINTNDYIIASFFPTIHFLKGECRHRPFTQHVVLHVPEKIQQVMAYLNDGGKQMVNNSPGETSLSGPQHRELPTKSSSIQSPGREQKAKHRVSQALFTQQLAENQQVSKPSTSQRQQEGNSVQCGREGWTAHHRRTSKITDCQKM